MAFVSASSTHYVFVEPETFRSLTLGVQHAVVAGVDLRVRVGDQVVFRERAAHAEGLALTFTGAWICRQCKHVIEGGPGSGIESGFVVLSLNNASENEWASARLKRRLALAERKGLSPERFWAFEDAQERERREVYRRTGIVPAERAP